MARNTLASVTARVDAQDLRLDRIEGLLITLVERTAPAVQTPAKPKAPKAKAAPKAAPTKGAQTRETLSRKDWNRTLTAKARLAGTCNCGADSVYRLATLNWDLIQGYRNEGMTPDQALERVMHYCG